MHKILTAIGALAMTTAAAHAGGIDRSGQSIGAIFETGDYAEFSFGNISPKISGKAVASLGGFVSGDMVASYTQVGGAVKTKLSDSLDFAVILDQPFGADVAYPTGTNYFAQGSLATLSTTDLTAILKYRTASNFSVYGGLRYETMSASAKVHFVAQYKVKSDTQSDIGYVVGVAYEKPEIALRVALTYNSKIAHDFGVVDSSLLTGGANVPGTTSIESPQSVNLDFQSGVAKDTLVFGSIRWVNWSAFVIDPPRYPAPGPLVSYDEDTITYNIGVGRKFNDNWAGSISLGYESQAGGFASNLGPTDGRTSVTIGAAYTTANKVKIAGGISYVQIGNAQTTLNDTTAASDFKGNSAVGLGLRISYAF